MCCQIDTMILIADVEVEILPMSENEDCSCLHSDKIGLALEV